MVGSLKEMARKACQWAWVDDNHEIEIAWQEHWNDIPDAFQNISPSSVFLSPHYLKSLEGQCSLAYGLFKCKGEAVGWAVFFLSPFTTTALPMEASQCVGIRQWVIQKWQQRGSSQWVLLLGNPFVSGEHGFVFKQGLSADLQAEILCLAMNKRVMDLRGQGWKVNICLIKDFHEQRADLQQSLNRCGFATMEADPIMVLPLLKEWKSLDHYLQALSSKFRSKALTAKLRSNQLLQQEWDIEEMRKHEGEWYPLYDQVYKHAPHRWQELSAVAMIQMKEELKDQMIFTAYLLGEELVAFSTAIFSNDEMEAHIVGFDYGRNKTHYLYSRMLYDYVELGIQKEVSRIVFGRTALEMKSALGAMPVNYSASLRHAQPLTNLAVRWLTGSIEYNAQEMRHPWKKEIEDRLTLLLPK
ncbi:MAG: hypothetical protein RLY35_76 [Bacteroidota bacterium]|jgi:hypothetical protein